MSIFSAYVLILALFVRQLELVKLLKNEASDLILMELVHELKIHCMISIVNRNEVEINVKDAKEFSMHFVSVRFETYDGLEELIIYQNIPNAVNLALVFRGNISEAVDILDKLKQVRLSI